MSLEKICCIILFPVLFFTSCKSGETSNVASNSDTAGTYFPIREFALAQYLSLQGQPLVLEKTAVFNGQVDSALVPIEKMDWGAIFKIFFATDIGDKKFLGQYKCSTFDNNATASVVYYYEALEPKLLTRVLEVSIDPLTSKVRSVYIETAQNSFWNEKSQKLFYAPDKTLQIQETEKPLMGSKKELRVTYKFL